MQGQVTQARQLVSRVWAKARRMSGSSDRRVVRSRRKRVVREGGGGRSSRVRRVGSRSFDVSNSTVVMVIMIIIGVRS